MNFKKGEKVRTEDGEVGEVLFIDRGGLEAQIALKRISIKLRTDSLTKFDSSMPATDQIAPSAAKVRRRPK